MRLWFTPMFLAAMVAGNYLAGTFTGHLPVAAPARWGLSHESIVRGELLRLITGIFLSHDMAMFWRQMLFSAVVIGAHEWVRGGVRRAAMFVAIDTLGVLVVLFAILPAMVRFSPGWDVSLLQVEDVGMSAGGFGLIGALAALSRWRWVLLALILGVIGVKAGLNFEPIADSAHLFCLCLGFGASLATGAGGRGGETGQKSTAHVGRCR